MAENAKDYEAVLEILTFAGVTGGLSRPHEKMAKKALERIRQNREWEVSRAKLQEREACAKVAERANRLDIAASIRARIS